MPTVPIGTNKSKDPSWDDLGCGGSNSHHIDCKFLVGPKGDTILGNRMIFALESAVFENMLCDVETYEIRLADDDPKAFRNLRYLIYNKNPSALEHFSVNDVLEVSELCRAYKVLSVSQMCRDHVNTLLNKGTVATALSAYYYGIRAGDKDIAKSADDFIKAKAKHHQMQTFQAIEAYFEDVNQPNDAGELSYGNSETKDELLKRCLNCIEFGKIFPREFLDGPGKSKILTADQKYLILSKLVSHYPSPNNRLDLLIKL